MNRGEDNVYSRTMQRNKELEDQVSRYTVMLSRGANEMSKVTNNVRDLHQRNGVLEQELFRSAEQIKRLESEIARLSSINTQYETIEQICIEQKNELRTIKHEKSEMQACYEQSMKSYDIKIAEMDKQIRETQHKNQALVTELEKNRRHVQHVSKSLEDKNTECVRLGGQVQECNMSKQRLLESNQALEKKNRELVLQTNDIAGKFAKLQSQLHGQAPPDRANSIDTWGFSNAASMFSSVVRSMSPPPTRPEVVKAGKRDEVNIPPDALRLAAVSISKPIHRIDEMIDSDVPPVNIKELIGESPRLVIEKAVTSLALVQVANEPLVLNTENSCSTQEDILRWIQSNTDALSLYKEIQSALIGGEDIDFDPIPFDASEIKRAEAKGYVYSSSSTAMLEDGFNARDFNALFVGTSIRVGYPSFFPIYASVIFRSSITSVDNLRNMLLAAESSGALKLPRRGGA